MKITDEDAFTEGETMMHVRITDEGAVKLHFVREKMVEGGELFGDVFATVTVPESCRVGMAQYARFAELYCAIAEAVEKGLKAEGV